MTSVVGEAAIRRVAKEARKERLSRIVPDDASHDSHEHAAYKPGAAAGGKGVLAALAQVGMRLSQVQRTAIARLLRLHPEMSAHPFTPSTAVEHLITHGVQFADAQLALVSDECTVSGFRRIQSGFDDCRTTASHVAYKPRTQTVLAAPEPGFFAWLRRLWAAIF
ncbi:MAG: hypothetical protein H6Q89_402 [Myxococcaceae bacterium]|nr:hypothetical protein [Myxococcaceae bacterium]